MTKFGRISAILLTFSFSAIAMAGSGDDKIHDHQKMKDHIERDKGTPSVQTSDCAPKSAIAVGDAESQKESAGGFLGECETAKDKKVHDHRKSKNL